MTQEITKDYDDRFTVIRVTNSKGETLCATDHFLITSSNEMDQERTSVHYTAGDPSMHVGRGRNPLLHTYGGILVDTVQNGNQMASWLYAYERFLRGTRCVRSGSIVEIMKKTKYRRGYMVSSKLEYNANTPSRAMFSFSLFVIDRGTIRWPMVTQLAEF